MSERKSPVYPNMDVAWSPSSTGYSMGIIAHNMAAMTEIMIEQQKANIRNATFLKQIDDSLRSIRKSLEEINKRRIVVQK